VGDIPREALRCPAFAAAAAATVPPTPTPSDRS
jgi:hypothetical protein